MLCKPYRVDEFRFKSRTGTIIMRKVFRCVKLDEFVPISLFLTNTGKVRLRRTAQAIIAKFFFLRFPCSDFHNGHSDVGGSINVAAYLLQFVNVTDYPESEPKSCYISFSMDFHCSYARDLIIIYFDILLVKSCCIRKWRIKAQLVWLPSHRKLKCSAKNCKFMHMNEYSLIYRSYCWLFAVYLLPLWYWSKYITNALDEIESNQVAVLARFACGCLCETIKANANPKNARKNISSVEWGCHLTKFF